MPLTMIEILKKYKDTCFILNNSYHADIDFTDDEYELLQDKIIEKDARTQYGLDKSSARFDWSDSDQIIIYDKERQSDIYGQCNKCLPFLANKSRQYYMEYIIINRPDIDYINCYLDIIDYHNLDKEECIYDFTILVLRSINDDYDLNKVELLKFLLKQGVDIYRDKGDLTLSPYEYCLMINDPLVTKLFDA